MRLNQKSREQGAKRSRSSAAAGLCNAAHGFCDSNPGGRCLKRHSAALLPLPDVQSGQGEQRGAVPFQAPSHWLPWC
jgi:hypothetical protein